MKYKIHFRYINSGQKAYEIVMVPDDQDPVEYAKKSWRGLTCESGGLRNILGAEEHKEETTI